MNGSQLAFGVRQNGQPVNNVQLPPWASGPDDMLAKHRYTGSRPNTQSIHVYPSILLVFKGLCTSAHSCMLRTTAAGSRLDMLAKTAGVSCCVCCRC